MAASVLVGLTIDTFKGIKPSILLKQIRRIGVEFAEVTVSIFDDIDQIIHTVDGMKIGLHLPIISEDGFDFSCIEKKQKLYQWHNLYQ